MNKTKDTPDDVRGLVPVVVVTLRGEAGLTLIEQPEIQVHPAMQVGLDDLLNHAATEDDAHRIFLIETHSEFCACCAASARRRKVNSKKTPKTLQASLRQPQRSLRRQNPKRCPYPSTPRRRA